MKVIATNIFFKANKMSQAQAQHINNKLINSKNVDIVCHDSTDTDSAYSALVMQAYLNKQGVNSRIILSQNIDSLRIKNPQNIIQSSKKHEIEKVEPDTVLCVDFGKQDRISSDVLKHVKKVKNIVGFDHHNDFDMTNDYTCIKKALLQEEEVPIGSYYIDTTAKSATSVIYRFFEALGEEITPEIALKLFKGMADDCVKKGLIQCDGLKESLETKKKLRKDKNAIEIYDELKEKIPDKQLREIIKEIDVLSSLTLEQQKFRDSLKEKMQISSNQKVAYVAIPPDDEQWQKLGGDNTVTSAILNRFRQEVLSENENIETAIVFYEAQGNYRLSVHDKNQSLSDFYANAMQNLKYPGFSIGGHNDRGGGKITTTDRNICSLFVKDIISYIK